VEAVKKAFRRHVENIGNALSEDGNTFAQFEFVRTIGTDNDLIRRLVDELDARGVARSGVAMIGEWDSTYARTFADALGKQLACSDPDNCPQGKLIFYQYLRGLDGLTVERAAGQGASTTEKSRTDSEKSGPPVEWPEGRDQ